MEILKEMINIITKNKIKNIEIIGDNPTNSSKINKLYNGIQSGQFLDEEAAINYFYGLDSKGKSNFKKLKKRLRGRLINTVFFVDIHKPSFSEIQKAYYTCYKNLAAIKILIGRAARRSAISLAEQTIKKAIQFEFSDIVLDIARILRIHYSAIESNSAKYDLYNR